jgi:hypothetical protein
VSNHSYGYGITDSFQRQDLVIMTKLLLIFDKISEYFHIIKLLWQPEIQEIVQIHK